MSAIKLSEDTPLKELFELVPETRNLLHKYGYSRILELDVEDIVIDKLSIRGLFRLCGIGEEELVSVLREIQSLYNKKLEDKL